MKAKKKSIIQKFVELAAFSMLVCSTASAQTNGGGHIGGGGEDGVFKSIRDEIRIWTEKNIDLGVLDTKLQLKDISGTQLYAHFSQAIDDVGEKVVFNHQEIKFGDNIRICKNDQNSKVITCNIEAWNSAAGNTRYMIVFHEYLGIAGIESNLEKDYSRYPISPEILKFVKAKNAFELALDEVIQNKCSVFVSENFDGLNAILTKKGYQLGDEQSPFQLINTKVFTSADRGDTWFIPEYMYEIEFFMKKQNTVIASGKSTVIKHGPLYPVFEESVSTQRRQKANRKAILRALQELSENLMPCQQ